MTSYCLYLNADADGFTVMVFYTTIPKYDQIIMQQKLQESEVEHVVAYMELKKINDNAYGFIYSYKNKKNAYDKAYVQATNIPECLRQALECKNRKEVAAYIKKYLLNAKESNQEEKSVYTVSNDDGTQTDLILMHREFYERNPQLNNHFRRYCGSAHKESPREMLDFVKKRSLFFKQNYDKGQTYKNTSWFNSSWLLTFLDYYLEALKNYLSYIVIAERF